MHAWMSFQDIISDAATRLQDIAQHQFAPGVLASWASDMNLEFARRSEAVRGLHSQPIIPGQQLYTIPANAHQLTRVSVLYPGYAARYELVNIEEDEVLDGLSSVTVGRPEKWYLTERRTEIGLYPIPSRGGFRGATSGDGNVGGTTLLLTDGSTEDDYYNDLVVKILSGDYGAEERTISDYDGGTGTVTVSPAFSGQILTGVQVAIGPDALTMQFVKHGNRYTLKPTAATVQAAPAPAPAFDQVTLDLPARPEDFWTDCEVWFKTGTLITMRARIITSTPVAGDPTKTTVTLSPELPAVAAAADSVIVTEIPNIPDAFHSRLVDGVVAVGLRTIGRPGSDYHDTRFDDGIAEAIRTFTPKQQAAASRIRECPRGEEDWDE